MQIINLTDVGENVRFKPTNLQNSSWMGMKRSSRAIKVGWFVSQVPTAPHIQTYQ